MKLVCIAAVLVLSVLGWFALQTGPEGKAATQESAVPVVREFAQFIEQSPEFARRPSSALILFNEKNDVQVPEPKALDESQKAFVGVLYEEFKRPERIGDPAWRRNVDDLIELASQTMDTETLDLLRAEILNVAAHRTLDAPTKEALRKWILRYQSIETRGEKRSEVSLNLLDP